MATVTGEQGVREALRVLRMRYRVTEIPHADDEFVTAVLAATQDRPQPDGPGLSVLATPQDGALAREQWQAVAEEGLATAPNKAAELALAATTARSIALAEMLGLFGEGKDGKWRAILTPEQMAEWQEKA